MSSKDDPDNTIDTHCFFFLFFIVFSYLLVNYRAHLLAMLCCCVCISLAASGCILVTENLFTTMTIAALDRIIINFFWLLVPCPKSFDLPIWVCLNEVTTEFVRYFILVRTYLR